MGRKMPLARVAQCFYEERREPYRSEKVNEGWEDIMSLGGPQGKGKKKIKKKRAKIPLGAMRFAIFFVSFRFPSPCGPLRAGKGKGMKRRERKRMISGER